MPDEGFLDQLAAGVYKLKNDFVAPAIAPSAPSRLFGGGEAEAPKQEKLPSLEAPSAAPLTPEQRLAQAQAGEAQAEKVGRYLQLSQPARPMVGGVMPRPAKPLPSYLTTGGWTGMEGQEQSLSEAAPHPYETLYRPDYINYLTAAAQSGDISPQRYDEELKRYQDWQQSSMGKGAQMAEESRQAYEQQQGFEQQRQALEYQRIQAEQQLYQQHLEWQKGQQLEMRQQQNDYNEAYQKQQNDYNQAISEVKAFRVNPMAGSFPVLDAAAAALGAIAAGLTGGPNQVLPILNKRIDDNIKAQQIQLGNLKDAAAMKANRLGMLRQKFGDDKMAMEAERRIQLEQLKGQLDMTARTTQSEKIRTDAAALSAATQAELLKSQREEELFHAQTAEAIAAAKARARMGAASAAASAQEKERLRLERELQGLGGHRRLDKGEEERLIPGVGIALPGSDVKALREETAKFGSTMRNIGIMSRIYGKYSGSNLVMSEDDKKQYQRAAAQIDVPTINKLAGASMTDAEMARIAPLLSPEATSAIGRQRYNLNQDMAAFTNQIQSAFRDKMGANIERGVATGMVTDPKTGERTRQYFATQSVQESGAPGGGGATVLQGAAPEASGPPPEERRPPGGW